VCCGCDLCFVNYGIRGLGTQLLILKDFLKQDATRITAKAITRYRTSATLRNTRSHRAHCSRFVPRNNRRSPDRNRRRRLFMLIAAD